MNDTHFTAAMNIEQMDLVVNNAKTEKGPWPETIVEEMEQSTTRCGTQMCS